ncbi:hypothetical protein KSF_002560 [Reticulibacter mediterranei]|uniref:DUF7779 domain-containing protein n=1 Tax=Reticulibacter mediterranei TaxID=2778369 RepID=A0A8J3ICZ0_9CHLR|nr:tetratricopeptide repeat protein [Reticulibacter mediterranei]GHO90208.1 hypothetical protein KSF_002560 [Reticulibacter mediterranei]
MLKEVALRAPVAADVFLLNQAIEMLRAYSLVRRDPGEKMLSIHRLVQAVLQDQLLEAERRTWAERAMLGVGAAFPSDEGDNLEQRGRLLAQALTATQAIKQYQFMGTEAGRLLFETASFLEVLDDYATTAEPLYQRALHIREQVWGPESLETAFTLISLANLYYEQGKYAEAEPLYQRVLHSVEQQLGPEHPLVISPLNGLANLYYEQSKYAEVEPLYQRALYIFEQ